MSLRLALLHTLYFFSGAAALGYQLVWTRMFTTGLGHEMPAVLAVLCAFFGGMALGSWTLDRRVSVSARPLRWYAALELVIGLWGFISTLLIPLANNFALSAIGLEPSPMRHWLVAFLLPFVTILPATAAMGATFPAMERAVSALVPKDRHVARVYAANTLGAVAGILGTTFLIAPGLGFAKTIFVLAGINVVSGLVAGAISAARTPCPRVEAIEPRGQKAGAPIRLYATLFFTGLLGIGFETVSVRVLSQILENTIYTFAAVLSVFLLGMSAGAGVYHRVARRWSFEQATANLLCAVTIAGGTAIPILAKAQPFYDRCRATLGDSTIGVLAAEMIVAAGICGVPTFFMGALFAHLVQAGRRAHGGIGRAAAVNTLGAACASLVFGVLLVPLIGTKWTLMGIAGGYLFLLPRFSIPGVSVCGALLVLIAALPIELRVVRLPPHGRLLEYREGIMASVSVIKDPTGDRTLRVNNRFQMGGTGAADAEYRHAHIPLLLHPEPKRALFLGLGTGITFGTAAEYPALEADGVELVPEVVEVMNAFAPHNHSPERQPRLKIRVADARRFVRATSARYDVIVADLFHPALDGAGALYTREHFDTIRQRLASGGLFCQWLPLHQLSDEMLRTITATFLDVFPNAQAWLLRFNVEAPVLGLIGSMSAIRASPNWIEPRLDRDELGMELKRLTLADSLRFFGHLLAGPGELHAFAESAAMNTDDHPRVIFGAPKFVYRTDAPWYGRLQTLLQLPRPNLTNVFTFDANSSASDFPRRLTGYIAARDVYLQGLINETEGRHDLAINAYIESARLSEDFTTGYAQCLRIASVEAKGNPTKARSILERLIEAQPERPVAREMLEKLFPK